MQTSHAEKIQEAQVNDQRPLHHSAALQVADQSTAGVGIHFSGHREEGHR